MRWFGLALLFTVGPQGTGALSNAATSLPEGAETCIRLPQDPYHQSMRLVLARGLGCWKESLFAPFPSLRFDYCGPFKPKSGCIFIILARFLPNLWPAFLLFWPGFCPISGLNFNILAPFWPFSGLHFDYLGPPVLVEQGLPISPLHPFARPIVLPKYVCSGRSAREHEKHSDW